MSKRTTIEAKRLRLRVPRLDDAEMWQRRIFGDPVVIRFLPVEAPLSIDRVRKAIPRALSHWTEHGYGLWVVEGREAGTSSVTAACASLMSCRKSRCCTARRRFLGTGYATEAGAAAVRSGFQEAGLERILALAFPENLASRRVMEKIGMRFEGERHAFGVDLVQYGLARSELCPTVEGYRLVGALGPFGQAPRPGGSLLTRQQPGSPGWPQQPLSEPKAMVRFRNVRASFLASGSLESLQFVKNWRA